jgi:1,4-alpha-glucan branching enzyme
MYAQPGKKLLFMGGEFAQWDEWSHDESLQWHLTAFDRHAGVQRLVGDLNRIYRENPALHRLDFDHTGFSWLEANDSDHGTLAFMRHGGNPGDEVVVICNFTPIPRENYRTGVPANGTWQEILNTDSRFYDGSGIGNLGRLEAAPVPYQGQPYSINLTLPPLAAVFLKQAKAVMRNEVEHPEPIQSRQP